jgi:BCCT family betaine/carnitine transporter
VLFCLLLIVTPLGNVRLGGADATPDYSYVGWFAMLFAAGMGIGLMFFGVLRADLALRHLVARGTSRWATVAALSPTGRPWRRGQYRRSRAHGHGRHDLSLGPASLGDLCRGGAGAGAVHLQQGPAADDPLGLLPDLRRAVWGWTGHIIDILAVFATLFGLATSLGFGAQQAKCGLGTSSASQQPTRCR